MVWQQLVYEHDWLLYHTVVQGSYRFKLVAIDLPSPNGQDERLYVEGNPVIYARSGVLAELRDPFLKALTLQAVSRLAAASHQSILSLSVPCLHKLARAAGLFKLLACTIRCTPACL